MSDSLWPHESQHTSPPCPSPTPGVHSNSRPSNRWCHPAISFSVIPFSCCPQSLPASESFPLSQLFAWGGQCTGVSALASFLPKNTQDFLSLNMILFYIFSWFGKLLCVKDTDPYLSNVLKFFPSLQLIFWLGLWCLTFMNFNYKLWFMELHHDQFNMPWLFD